MKKGVRGSLSSEYFFGGEEGWFFLGFRGWKDKVGFEELRFKRIDGRDIIYGYLIEGRVRISVYVESKVKRK